MVLILRKKNNLHVNLFQDRASKFKTVIDMFLLKHIGITRGGLRIFCRLDVFFAGKNTRKKEENLDVTVSVFIIFSEFTAFYSAFLS